MANTVGLCGNCRHVHPTQTSKSTTTVAPSCDQCNCVMFRHASHRPGKQSGQLDSNDTPGHALALENNALKEHITHLRERVPETDATFTAKEVEHLRIDAATAHAELKRQQMGHAQKRRELERLNTMLAKSISDANTLAEQLRVIAEKGYSNYTHPAVVTGIKQLNDTLTVALAFSQTNA